MNILKNADLFSIGVTSAAIGILGLVVFFSNSRSITNRTFLFFSIVTIVYGVFNFINYQIVLPDLILLFIRLTIFSAVWHTFSFFQLFYVFPEEKKQFSAYYKFLLVPFTVIVSFLTLTPLFFPRIEQAPIGQVSTPVPAPGIFLFGITVIGLLVSGISLLIKKMLGGSKEQSRQLKFILIGTLITFALLITFNLIFPVLFNNVSFIPFAPLFIFPFIVFTAYAIIKHHLFDVKVIATEIAVFLLLFVLIIQFVNAEGLNQIIVSGIVLISTLAVGLFLIRSVLQEIKQREQIATLNLQLQRSIVELQKVDEVKSEFVSLASHQLRTPLTVIKGYVDMLRSGDFGGLNEEQKDATQKVFISSERMVDLIDDLLNVSKLEKEGGFTYQFQAKSPIELVANIVEEFQQSAKEKGLMLSFTSHVNPDVRVKFDPDKLKEAVGNIISNSIKYTPQGSVAVSATEDEDAVTISVRDTGVGIAKDDIPKIFQKFFRSKAVARLTTEGTGLGLFFTRRVIEDHKGRVWVESEGVGKGSTFIVKLPKVNGKTLVEQRGEETEAGSAKESENGAPKESEARKGTEVIATEKLAEQKAEEEKPTHG